MDIHQQNETVLSHPAVRKKENTVVDVRKGSQSAFVEGIYSGSCAVSSSKASPAGIGTRADMSTLVVNRNQAKRVSAMDNEINYDSILTKYTK